MAYGEIESASSVVNISGQPVTISGNFIEIQSGTQVAIITLSGDYVNITGAASFNSGTGVLVQTQSGALVNVTGNILTSISGNIVSTSISGDIVSVTGKVYVITLSGDYVSITGSLSVTTSVSGNIVQISGQTVRLQSGTTVLTQSTSGELLRMSGLGVTVASGLGVIINSGIGVLISGQGVTPPLSIINKTQTTSGSANHLIPPSFVSSTTVVISSPLNVSTNFGTTVMIHMGRVTATAFGASPVFRVEASARGSLDGHWYPVSQFTSALGSSIASGRIVVANSGTNLISTTTTTSFSSQNIIFINDVVLANSEFARITVVTSGVSINTEDSMLFTHTSATIFNQAEMYLTQIDDTSIGRLRVIADDLVAGQTFVAEAEAVTGDSIT